jgi:hypothetical protein
LFAVKYARIFTELLGLFWTLSIVWYGEDKKKNHNVSETGFVSVLRWMGQDKPTQLGPLERASLNHWTGLFCPIHLRTETDPVSETLWSFVKLLHTRRWIKSKISPIILYNIHNRQDPFKSICTSLFVPGVFKPL